MGCTLAPPGNTTEPSMCGGDAAFLLNTMTTCYYYYFMRYSFEIRVTNKILVVFRPTKLHCILKINSVLPAS